VTPAAAPSFALDARCPTADHTRALAGALAIACRPGDVLLLVGGLGAGKTTFAQGFGAALGVEDPITSPTFTLVRQYPCSGVNGVEQLIHADVYRLDRLAEVVDLALDELVEQSAVALVEWGDAAAPVLGDETLTVALDRSEDDDSRRVALTGAGPSWVVRHDELARAVAPFALEAR
jgi:tRNA threonylcarbamoyladenosine biosynthesis protein TsaE